MKFLKCVLTFLLLVPNLLWASDVIDLNVSLSQGADNSLIMTYDYSSGNKPIFVKYNIFYAGDNYPEPVPLYKGDLDWIGMSPGVSGDVEFNEAFIREKWIPEIRKNVKNAVIWMEYSINNHKPISTNKIQVN